jgi:hypothetical protein
MSFEIFRVKRNGIFISRCSTNFSDCLEFLLVLVPNTQQAEGSINHWNFVAIGAGLKKGSSNGPSHPTPSQQADDCVGGTSVPNRGKNPTNRRKSSPDFLTNFLVDSHLPCPSCWHISAPPICQGWNNPSSSVPAPRPGTSQTHGRQMPWQPSSPAHRKSSIPSSRASQHRPQIFRLRFQFESYPIALLKLCSSSIVGSLTFFWKREILPGHSAMILPMSSCRET